MKNNIIAVIIALITSGIFLYSALTPPSMFNLLPFALYEIFFLEVTENGVSSSIEEDTFITAFDIIIAFLIFWLAYALSKKILVLKKSK